MQREKEGRESPEPEAKRAHELSVVANVLRAETQPTDRDRANGTCEARCEAHLRNVFLRFERQPCHDGRREGKPGSIETLKIMELKVTLMERRRSYEAVFKQGVLFAAQRIMVTR